MEISEEIQQQIDSIEKAPTPYIYNGEIIGHPFNLIQFISTFGRNNIPDCLGIYHLFYKDMLVYIGMSKNLQGRLVQHVKDKDMVFDNCLWFTCRDITIENVLNIEYNMIKKFKPSLNSTYLNAR